MAKRNRHPNITRYTYKFHSFDGFRLSISRNRNTFTKYFSVRQYGTDKEALKAAQEMRARILAELQEDDADPKAIFDRYKQEMAEAKAAKSQKVEA